MPACFNPTLTRYRNIFTIFSIVQWWRVQLVFCPLNAYCQNSIRNVRSILEGAGEIREHTYGFHYQTRLENSFCGCYTLYMQDIDNRTAFCHQAIQVRCDQFPFRSQLPVLFDSIRIVLTHELLLRFSASER